MSRPVPIAEFARVIHPRSAKHKVVAVLVAYFDESGFNPGSYQFLVGGAIGKVQDWDRLEPLWEARLQQDNVKVFHASHCVINKGEFGDIQHWTRTRQQWLFGDLGRIMASCNLSIIGANVWASLWNTMFPYDMVGKPGLVPEASPYNYCIAACMSQAVEWSRLYADEEPVALVFAIQDQYQGAAKEIIDLYEWEINKLNNKVASVSFSTPERLIPLQTADYAVYFFYQGLQGANDIRESRIPTQINSGSFGLFDKSLTHRATYKSLLLQKHHRIRSRRASLHGHIFPLLDYRLEAEGAPGYGEAMTVRYSPVSRAAL